MFGEFDYTFRYESEDISVRVDQSEDFYQYFRESAGERISKVISGGPGTIVINPVEPINLPQEVTSYLEIHFTPVAVEPASTQSVYLKFPIEIGVFLESKGDYDILDIFTLTKPKYSLYGSPEEGVITRYYESPVSGTIPSTELLKEGVVALTISNMSRSWMEVSRVVLDCKELYLYYSDMVSITASMDILSKNIADVRTEDRPLKEGMKTSVLLTKARTTLIPEKIQFMMEFGVGD